MPDESEPTGLYHQIGAAVEGAMVQDQVALSEASAWNFLYRYGMGVEHGMPHIVESNYLSSGIWRTRAQRVLAWLGKELVPGTELTEEQVLERLDTGWRVAQQSGYTGTKPNLAGSSMEYGLSYLLEKFCGVAPLVKQSVRKFRGYEIARRAEVEQLDLALFSFDDFRLFISAFWTTRKDRIAADLYEANFLRQRRPDVGVAFVVNEFQPSLLNHLINAPGVDRVYHVCLDALLACHSPFIGVESLSRDQLVGRSAAVREYHSYLSFREFLHPLERLFRDVREMSPDLRDASE